MSNEDRASFTAGLRAVADFLDSHPEVPLPYLGAYAEGSSLPSLPIYLHGRNQKADLATIARALGNATKAPASYRDGDGRFQVWREFEGIVLLATADRGEVCTRVVTGTEDREVEEVVTPAVTRKVTKSIETVEWRCEPLLATPGEMTDAALEHDPAGVADAVTAALAADGPVTCRTCGVTAPKSQMTVVLPKAVGGEFGDPQHYCADIVACNDRRHPQLVTLLQAQQALVSRLAEDQPKASVPS